MSSADRRRPDWELIKQIAKESGLGIATHFSRLPIVEVPALSTERLIDPTTFSSNFEQLPWQDVMIWWPQPIGATDTTVFARCFTRTSPLFPTMLHLSWHQLKEQITNKPESVQHQLQQTFSDRWKNATLIIELHYITSLPSGTPFSHKFAAFTTVKADGSHFNVSHDCDHLHHMGLDNETYAEEHELLLDFLSILQTHANLSYRAIIEGLYLIAERRPEPTDQPPAKPHILKEKPWMREDCPTIICIDPNAPAPTTRAAIPVNSHRSPRHHIRSGHWRVLRAERFQRNGKKQRPVWVKSTTVGNKEWVAEGARYKLIDIPRPQQEAQA